MRASTLLAALLGMAAAAFSSTNKSTTRSPNFGKTRGSRGRSVGEPNPTGAKLAKLALKGRIGTCHGTGYIAKAHATKASKARRKALK